MNLLQIHGAPVALLFAMGTSMVSAVDYVVTTEADEAFNGGSLVQETADGTGLSFREAVALANLNAPDGDTVTFSAISFALADVITLSTPVAINDDLAIDGTLPLGRITLEGDPLTPDRLLEVDLAGSPGAGVVSFTNLILQNGVTPGEGAGILIAADTAVEVNANTDIQNCRAENGGAIYNCGSLSVSSAVFQRNAAVGASGSGGGIFNAAGATLTVENSTFTGNLANRAGGAIEDQAGDDATTMITGTTFTENNAGVAPATAAPGNGGAIHITGPSDMVIQGGAASTNIAASEGGAFWNGTGTMTIRGVMIGRNIASGAAADHGGGGVFNNGGNVVIFDTEICGNIANGASGSGGGIFSTDGKIDIMDSTIVSNVANRAGGGIEIVNGGLNLTNVTLGGLDEADGNIAGPAGSAAPGNGGGLHVTGKCETIILGGLVSSNVAAREGGGLWNQNNSTMTLDKGVVVARNRASGDAADDGGGGIFNNGGDLIIKNSADSPVEISGNVADGASGSGGGIFVLNGTATIEAAAISDNLANRAGGGIEDATGDGLGLILTGVNFTGNNAGVSDATASPGNGGAVHVTGPGDVEVSGGVIEGNRAHSEGGGLWNGTGTMTISATEFRANTASGDDATHGGGGVFNAGGAVIIGESIFQMNVAIGDSSSGGGIFNDVGGRLEVSGTTFFRNGCNRAGGAIEDNSGPDTTVLLTNNRFERNFVGVGPAVAAPGNGGAIHISGTGGMMITDCVAVLNIAAREGGAYWNGGGTMVVTGGEISENDAQGPAADDGGGGIFNNGGRLEVSGTTLLANLASGTAGSGGGIFNLTGGAVSITDATLSANSANRAGGGVEATSMTVTTINGCRFEANLAGPEASAAPGNGGGFHITGAGEVIVSESTFAGNLAANEGGGLWNSGAAKMNIVRSTIMTGTSPDGGGLFQQAGADGALTVINSTVSGNVGRSAGGVQIEGGKVTFLNSTIAANDLEPGAAGGVGGVNVVAGDLILHNTIVGNNSESDVAGAVADGQFSLIGDAIDATGVADGTDGMVLGVDPLLGELADNGGPTLTHLPGCDSAAYQGGSNDLIVAATDQRSGDFDRIYAGKVDMGSVELRVTSYEAWAEQFFDPSVPMDQRQPGDNPDGDFRDNGMEFLTGSNPGNGSDGPAVEQGFNDSGELTIRYDLASDRKAGVDGFEISTDLETWGPAMNVIRRVNPMGGIDRIELSVSSSESKIFARIFLNIP